MCIPTWLRSYSDYSVLITSGIDGAIKLRPSEAELKTMKGFEGRWKSYYAQSPDKPVMLMATMGAYVGLNPEVAPGKYYSVAYFSVCLPLSQMHGMFNSST